MISWINIIGLVKVIDCLLIIKGHTFLAMMILISMIVGLSVKFDLVWRQDYRVVWFLGLL